MTNNMGCKNCKYTDEFCTSGDCPDDKTSIPDYELLPFPIPPGVEMELVGISKQELARLKTMEKKYLEQFARSLKLADDCITLAQKLLQVKPELREWLETNFKEYL